MTTALTEIRPMHREDAPQLARLEALVEASPWSEKNFLDSLNAGHLGFILEKEGQIAAWAVVMTVLDEAELLIIGVRPDMQRQGLGSKLLSFVLRELRGRTVLMNLEVRAGNLPAIGLYKRFGFLQTGIRRGYYPGENGSGREDALLMSLSPLPECGMNAGGSAA
ncbi:ribosomal-protein-alanine N-acetyltransferase [Sutterella faecalis]|uniref:[Ribosomal protein bS18]-alanine N-acetyltransferase n=2 Tax=Sutterella TaxID=40544 RepID=A0AAI9SB81_9BURK|nr:MULTISPECIES: ribosomal protein S18-alanine N-acetyltransferase [Sutterella]KAB7650856.1 ribosomal-protein-alanine N-acetyltransferase [Sutterella seckii]QDA55287.1 ribosomal-protein-alanine N-acetyltransferase [Sutterella faecalis]